jgi:hypothetical protein
MKVFRDFQPDHLHTLFNVRCLGQVQKTLATFLRKSFPTQPGLFDKSIDGGAKGSSAQQKVSNDI